MELRSRSSATQSRGGAAAAQRLRPTRTRPNRSQQSRGTGDAHSSPRKGSNACLTPRSRSHSLLCLCSIHTISLALPSLSLHLVHHHHTRRGARHFILPRPHRIHRADPSASTRVVIALTCIPHPIVINVASRPLIWAAIGFHFSPIPRSIGAKCPALPPRLPRPGLPATVSLFAPSPSTTRPPPLPPPQTKPMLSRSRSLKGGSVYASTPSAPPCCSSTTQPLPPISNPRPPCVPTRPLPPPQRDPARPPGEAQIQRRPPRLSLRRHNPTPLHHLLPTPASIVANSSVAATAYAACSEALVQATQAARPAPHPAAMLPLRRPIPTPHRALRLQLRLPRSTLSASCGAWAARASSTSTSPIKPLPQTPPPTMPPPSHPQIQSLQNASPTLSSASVEDAVNPSPPTHAPAPHNPAPTFIQAA